MMKRAGTTAALLLMVNFGVAHAQTTTATAHAKARKAKTVHRSAPATDSQVEALRHEMQSQIDALKTQVSAKDAQLSAAQQSTDSASQQAATAAQQASAAAAASQQNSDQVQQLQGQVNSLQTTNAGLQETVIRTQQEIRHDIENPMTLRYKGVNITPVAFFAFEGVWRQRSVNSDINTPFNSIPFPGATEGHVSELNFSGRQSRVGALFTGDAGNWKLSGYVEADFLGVGAGSNNNQSNSYVLRQRQIWGQGMTKGGFGVTGGQMWSLVTEDGHGTDNRTEKLPNTIDPQYMVGFSWTRQPAIRVQQRWGSPTGNGFTAAISAEQAQITNFTAATASGLVPANFFFAGAGQNGGLYNAAANFNTVSGAAGAITTYANNVAPDVIAKGALDAGHVHIEVGGLARFLRDYYHPITNLNCGTVAGACTLTYAYNNAVTINDTRVGGGVFGSVRAGLGHYVDVAVQAMAGTGIGRYGSSQLADATLHVSSPTQTTITGGYLVPIKNYHGMFSLETHPTKKLDVYAYYGGEYAQRTYYTVSQPTATPGTFTTARIGYGAPDLSDTGCYSVPGNNLTNSGTAGSISTTGSCASPTRYIQEGMIGFTYRLINSPRFGRLQYQATYSYIQRNLWSGVTSGTFGSPSSTQLGPRALDNMVHVGMRYYIP